MEVKKILVLNEKVEDAEAIEQTYNSCEIGDFDVTSVFKAEEAVSALRDTSSQLLVFNLKDFSKKKLNAVTDLRKLGVDFPLLSIADTYDEAAYNFVRKLDNSVLLNRPYADSQLLTLSAKMAEGSSAIQRQFPRFGAKETAYLSLYPDGTPTKVELRDLSKGGVRLLAPVDVGLKSGDIIRIKFFLESVGTHHHFSGVVKWMELVVEQGQYNMGIRFLSEGEVFRSLLSGTK